MKPLVRWTTGPVSSSGLKVLQHSLACWRRTYKDRFDLMVCYNNIDSERLHFVHSYGAILFNSTEKHQFLGMDRWGVSWKICPPRIRPESYELILDNDVVIHGKSDIFESSISDNMCMMTEGYYRKFGKYSSKLPLDIKLNSGFIGLPPYYDFGQDLKSVFLGWDKIGPSFDEQGLVASAIIKNKYNTIPLTELHVCVDKYINTPFGLHFVGVNSGLNTYWEQHRKIR